jgi:hypothetical protein
MAAIAASYAAGLAIPSAAGGWDIPRDTLAMVHEKEMILPAKHADVIRSLSDGGSGGAAGGQTHLHVNVAAMDGASVRRVLLDNTDAVAAALKKASRDFLIK